jgi:hypothetical protein
MSAVCHLMSVICCLLSAVWCLLSAVCCLLYAVCCVLCADNNALFRSFKDKRVMDNHFDPERFTFVRHRHDNHFLFNENADEGDVQSDPKRIIGWYACVCACVCVCVCVR